MNSLKKFWASGEPFIWITGGALALAIVFVFGLFWIILVNGFQVFWASDILHVQLRNGAQYLGQVRVKENIPAANFTNRDLNEPLPKRLQLQVGNRDLYGDGQDFQWVKAADIEIEKYPKDAVLLERREWGNFYGFIKQVEFNGNIITDINNPKNWNQLQAQLDLVQDQWEDIYKLQKYEIGDINKKEENLRLTIRRIELNRNAEIPATQAKIAALQQQIEIAKEQFQTKEKQLNALREELQKNRILLLSVDGQEQELPLANIVRAYKPNNMGLWEKIELYIVRLWEFFFDEPRESNTEGGIFPAIFGTVLMVLLMTIAVVPVGILAALYLREYAKQGLLVRIVRIAVNNLAGVPSIVFGVFGLGFFVYFIGGGIDQFFYPESLPTPTYGTGGILWASLTLALLTVPVVIVATEEGLAAVPKEIRHASYALGATKFETMWRVIIPSAMPGILTGVILAIARATGEVAPLMITGVVKLAPSLPLDSYFPFIHLERKFMHLGFHIYDVGFQSPNVEAAKPMVYATALLLIGIVVALNLAAIMVRNRLRKKYRSSVF